MTQKHIVTHSEVQTLTATLGRVAQSLCSDAVATIRVYPVPRGGVPVAYLLSSYVQASVRIVDNPDAADIIVDDLIDSGATCEKYCELYPEKPFLVLIDKRSDEEYRDKWIVFPWEETAERGIEDHITRILQYTGDNPTRGGLLETPKRVAKALQFWFSGYNKDPADVLKVFEDGADGYDQMIVVKDIPIYSHCEHHMAAIIGTATIAYIPNGKIVGLSKLSRIADIFARRLQVQERLTTQIADALMKHLQPSGVGVMIKARHLCMESRGVCQQGHHTITTVLRGALLTEPETRAEFMELTK